MEIWDIIISTSGILIAIIGSVILIYFISHQVKQTYEKEIDLDMDLMLKSLEAINSKFEEKFQEVNECIISLEKDIKSLRVTIDKLIKEEEGENE